MTWSVGFCADARAIRNKGRIKQRFAVCIRLELEIKSRKSESAKNGGPQERDLLLIQHPHCFEGHRSDNFQTFWAEFIDRVLRGMPENIVVAVIEIDQVGAGNTPLHKGFVVVAHRDGSSKEVGLIAHAGR